MSDQVDPPDPGTPDQDGPVVNPVSNGGINLIGVCSVLLAVLFFYLLITTWPVPEFAGTAFRPVNIFGWSHSWSPDRHMLFTVMMAGALGSLVHTMASFGDYVGNRKLSYHWLWFLALRIPVGIAIAVLFYLVIRGGILVPTLQGQPEPSSWTAATLKINPYSIAGFSALAGMFSRQATDKLAAVFDAVFSMKDPVKRADPLKPSQPFTVVTTLRQGMPQDLTVKGSGFTKDTTATVNGKDRKFTIVSATEGKVTITDEDVKEKGPLALVVTNPDKTTFNVTISVAAAGAT